MNSGPETNLPADFTEHMEKAFASIYSVSQKVMDDAMKHGVGYLKMTRTASGVEYTHVPTGTVMELPFDAPEDPPVTKQYVENVTSAGPLPRPVAGYKLIGHGQHLGGFESRGGEVYWAGTDDIVDWEALVKAGFAAPLYECPTCGEATMETP